MTGRVSQKLEKSSLIKGFCSKGQSYLHDYFFVSLTNVYSTQLGILTLDNDDKLIAPTDVEANKKSLKSLLFIELQGYRKCIVYVANEAEKYNNMNFDDKIIIT
jgi:hypothetical protein